MSGIFCSVNILNFVLNSCCFLAQPATAGAQSGPIPAHLLQPRCPGEGQLESAADGDYVGMETHGGRGGRP